MRKVLSLAATVALLAMAGCGPKKPDYGTPAVRINPSSLNFTAAGGSETVQLTATVAWKLQGSLDWIKVSPLEGDPSKEVQKITVTATANTGLERTGSVTFKQVDGTLSAALNFSQEAFIPEVSAVQVRDVVKASDPYKYQRYRLSGMVRNVQADGSFDLIDASGSILVKGLNANEGAYGQASGSDLAGLGVHERDQVTIVGYRVDVDGKPQIHFAYLEKVTLYSEPDPEKMETKDFPFSADFTKGAEGFVVNNKVFPFALDALWLNSAAEGWAGNGYMEGAKFATESWLYSPKIKLAGAKDPILVFDHIVQFFDNIDVAKEQTAVWIKKDGGTWKKLAITFSYPDELGSTVMTSENINLSDYIGATVQFAFQYLSNASHEAGKWQILNFHVKENVEPSQGDNSGGTEDYNKPGWDWGV